ncbi:hypothetical protein CB1_068050010 [Camelus ferus]|nr:hypothetical protein CB1_068050010 [Camelus ferus]
MNCWGCILVPGLKKLNELSSPSPKRMGPGKGRGEGHDGSAAPPRLRPARDPANPAPHSCLVELSEAYQALNQGQSRRSYDRQLRWATFPKFPGTTVHPSLLIKHTAPGHPPVHNTGPSFMV